MGRTKARLIAILGVAIALALPPRMAFAKSWIPITSDTFEYSLVPVTFDGTSYQTVNSDFTYPLLPYSAPYVDSTSSSFAESGSAHSDFLITEQEYTIDLNQFDAKLKFWVPTIQVSPINNSLGFSVTNPNHSSSTVLNGSYNPTGYYVSAAAGGTGAWSFDGRLYDDSGYYYSKDDQFTVNEHDSTGEVATDYASEGSSTGLVTHVMPLGEGLWYSELPRPSASSDGNVYFALLLRGSGSVGMGSNGRPFRQGDYFRMFTNYFTYWADEVYSTSGVYKKPFNASFCGYLYGNVANGLNLGTPNSDGLFELPSSALIFGVLFQMPNNSNVWNSRVVTYFPSLYLIDMETEVTIRDETQAQTEEMMDTSGSGSIFSGLLDVATDTLENNTGFLGQLASITDTYNSIIADSSGSGLVMFPGVTVLGVQLIEPQNVSLFQGALSQFTEPVRMVWTFIFVTAWINGMKHLWEVQVLGYASDGELARRARIEMDMDPDIPF